LFIVNRPMSVKKLADVCGAGTDEVSEALDRIAERMVGEESGLRLVRSANDVQLTTNPDNASMVQDFLKDETTGELTKPSLETLTIVAYRGPLTKPELEQIRGVNCTLILRNLLMRGLVEAEGDTQDLTAKYRVTIDFLKFLGVSEVDELPNYDKLRTHENILRAVDRVNGNDEAEEKGEDAVSEQEISEEAADPVDGDGKEDDEGEETAGSDGEASEEDDDGEEEGVEDEEADVAEETEAVAEGEEEKL